MVSTIPRVTAHVDLSAIAHNLERVRAFAPHSRVMAAVKADAYGHGAVQIAKTLVDAKVDALAVACLEEALRLREAGIAAPIVLLEGVLSAEEAAAALQLDLQIVVHDDWQLALLEAMPEAPWMLWLKIDSGMHRLGFAPSSVTALNQTLRRYPFWQLRGWMTHLACAEETDNAMTARQIQIFDTALEGLPGARSIANSAGLIAWPEARRDWVRPGLMLYGVSPLPGTTADQLGLRPAMRLESRLLTIKRVAANETIGYGATYRTPQAMQVGIVAVGYADGVDRMLPSGTPVLLNGLRVPMLGRVSMDMIAIDLDAVPQAKVGDTVRLWGDALPAEEIAVYAGTLAYELFCGLTRRVHFRYSGGNA